MRRHYLGCEIVNRAVSSRSDVIGKFEKIVADCQGNSLVINNISRQCLLFKIWLEFAQEFNLVKQHWALPTYSIPYETLFSGNQSITQLGRMLQKHPESAQEVFQKYVTMNLYEYSYIFTDGSKKASGECGAGVYFDSGD